MKKLLASLFQSFTTGDSGFSARKLSAFTAVAVSIYVTVGILPKEFLIEALYAWLGFALLCLGIVTLEQILRFKNDTTTTPTISN